MSENTKIQWADHTFNPWEGCTKVSQGCTNCYAENRNARFGGGTAPNWGRGKPRRRTSAANWRQPAKWNKEAEARPFCCPHCGKWWQFDNCADCDWCGFPPRRPRVFCASLADLFDDEVPTQWRADFFHLVDITRNIDWLMLTKRPENWYRLVADCIPKITTREDWKVRWLNGFSPDNVWIGASVEDQANADERIPDLLKIPARVRFLSVEPMLGPIDLAHACFNGADSLGTMHGIHWAIFGGESGPGARPCDSDWIRDGIRQCRSAGVSPFVKQLGTRSDVIVHDKKGGELDEWPEDLRVREFPK